MDIYRAPSQESPGHLQYKLNTQMHACVKFNHICKKLALNKNECPDTGGFASPHAIPYAEH